MGMDTSMEPVLHVFRSFCEELSLSGDGYVYGLYSSDNGS